MRRNRWLPLAISFVGILNVVIVGQLYLLDRMVVYPLSTAAASSPAAKGLSRLSTRIESGQIRIQPEAEIPSVKNAVQFALIGLRQQTSESEVRLNISREMLIRTIVVFALQLLLAAIAFVHRENASTSGSKNAA